MKTGLHVLLEDNHLLVVSKPAQLPTMGAARGQPSLVSIARQYLKDKYAKPGNVYVGVVSRLDAVATGVLILARTSKAAARLSDQYRRGQVQKQYWAIVAGQPRSPTASLEDWLLKDESARRMKVVPCEQTGAKLAKLSYCQLRRIHKTSLLKVNLHTGRKHQIRVQLAHLGHPILGDQKYGSKTSFPSGIALHARTIGFRHPVRKTWIELTASLPKSWRQAGVDEAEQS